MNRSASTLRLNTHDEGTMTRLQASCAAILLILTLGLFVTRQHAETAQTPAGAGGQQIAESPDLTADLPVDARAALKQYLDKASAALDPLQKKCLDQLQALQKKYLDAGNNLAARPFRRRSRN
jgi:hypothetical protein